jgi:hypothetical protein
VASDNPVHRLAQRVDRDNRLLWHARRLRLEGEAVRDAMLAVAGELNGRMYGASARPKLPANISKYAWTPDARTEDQQRRSIYVLAKRNMRFPLFDAFDLPDMHNSCARRLTTTTAPQALLLLNGDFARECGQKLARHLNESSCCACEEALLAEAYQRIWGRRPVEAEIELGKRFLNTQAKADAALAEFCHALLNTNEFLFID